MREQRWTGESPIQKRKPPLQGIKMQRITDQVHEPPVNNRRRYSALGMIFSEKKVKRWNVGLIRRTADASSIEVYWYFFNQNVCGCLFMATIDMFEIDFGTTMFGESPVWSGETPMECRSNFEVGFRSLIVSHITSVVCKLLPATRRLVVCTLLVYSVLCLILASHQRFADSSYDSPVLRRCCQEFYIY
ncbi:hypothetical protein HAX54_019084, partial [Datura stramonium]|nr:hypothetical protein [Datura stramonium]